MIAALVMSISLAQPVPTETDLHQEIAKRDAAIAGLLTRVQRLEALLQPQNTPATAPAAIPLDIERALDMVLIERGAQLLPAGQIELTPSIGWATRSSETVGLAMIDGELAALEERVRTSAYTVGLTGRIGLPKGFQAEVSVPYRFVDRDFSLSAGTIGVAEASESTSGFGDIRLSLSKALTSGDGSMPKIIARIGGDIGNARRSQSGLGVGGGFASLDGSLTVVERLDPLVFVGSVRYGHGLSEDGIDPGDSHGGSIATYLAAGPETSLRFIFDYTKSGNAHIDGIEIPDSGTSAAIFSLGASVANSSKSLIDFSAGIGLTPDSPDFILSLAVPIRP